MTAHGDMETAVEAMRLGAWDYLAKPLDVPQLERLVASALEDRTVSTEVASLREEAAARHGLTALAGRSSAMQEVYKLVGTVAPKDASVLILGETGTGKELLARLIHEQSPRAQKPFIRLNCAALPEGLLESELFGHERGAFTGAVRRREGRFELADGGTLLLDEIGELPLGLQPKLLRALEQEEFERVGGARTLRVDVRVIGTTNRDLQEEIRRGRFREDLYYRLQVMPFEVSPRSGSGWRTCLSSRPGSSPRTARTRPRCRRTRWRCSSGTSGRATCASSGTWSSGRACWRAAA
jgi:DNA-binding NtrC family response regulator